MPKPAHEPSKASRQLVELHSTIGTPQMIIADLLEINHSTLIKHYRKELDQANHKANAQVGGALFKKAIGGDTTAMIFWMKTRAKWREGDEPKPAESQAITINIVDAKKPDAVD